MKVPPYPPITHAISLYAPWAWAILNLGKDVENRSMGFPKATGWVWLHCSKSRSANQTQEDWAQVLLATIRANRCLPTGNHDQFEQMIAMRGHIIGAVEITGRVTQSTSPWFVGPLGLTLGERFALVKPVPAKGALGVWRVPAGVGGDQ